MGNDSIVCIACPLSRVGHDTVIVKPKEAEPDRSELVLARALGLCRQSIGAACLAASSGL